jgi:hypothetical protein
MLLMKKGRCVTVGLLLHAPFTQVDHFTGHHYWTLYFTGASDTITFARN